jgi:hypothetical protein
MRLILTRICGAGLEMRALISKLFEFLSRCLWQRQVQRFRCCLSL